MDKLLQIVFLLNSVLGFVALVSVDKAILKKKRLSSLSDFVRVSKKDYYLLEILLLTLNILQGIFCFYLFTRYHFPESILFGSFAGLTGIVATLARIDKHKIFHISMTVVACSMYTLSVILTSILLNQTVLIVISFAQVVLFLIGFIFRIKMKHLEVLYFYFLGLWNVLVFIFFIRG